MFIVGERLCKIGNRVYYWVGNLKFFDFFKKIDLEIWGGRSLVGVGWGENDRWESGEISIGNFVEKFCCRVEKWEGSLRWYGIKGGFFVLFFFIKIGDFGVCCKLMELNKEISGKERGRVLEYKCGWFFVMGLWL